MYIKPRHFERSEATQAHEPGLLRYARNEGVLLCAVFISIALHAIVFWRAPIENGNNLPVPGGQSMAVSLGAPPEPKKTVQPTAPEKMITTTALDAQLNIAPEKEEPEIIETKAPEVIEQLEELIVTKEVKLSSRPIPPVYPDKARRDKQEGLVLVRAQVNEQGKTLLVKVAKSSGFPLLDEAALVAIKQWSFLPAQQNEKAIMAWIEVPIDFKLR